ncbi:MAG: hypothetical protein IMZ52_07650 [Actinobacteria bacterium]|nr:hypothetical protein [Actinomycetota bacterium]MBE3114599.1 hypothetical protein [Actinomycetota bacterium]
MTFSSLLVHNSYIQTKYSSQNSLGEWLFTYSSSSTPFACRMSPLSAMERIDLTGRFDDVRYRCFCEPDIDLTVDNRLVYNSETYRVKEVITDSSYHHKVSYLTEL